MLRMEVACLSVIIFMSIMYFSAKRKRTRIHRVFSALLILSAVNLIFDCITIYTVNRLDMIPIWANDILHKLFIGTMPCIFYLIYRYSVLLIGKETLEFRWFLKVSDMIAGIMTVGVIVLPIYYVETPKGNYSYGMAVFTGFASVGIFMCLTIVTLYRHWKPIQCKKKLAISLAMTIEIILSLYQAIRPLSLVSGMGLMLINLAFYLIMENPDIALVQQVQAEKQRADDANAAKSVFLSNMSHEIRTPMNAIVGMTEILLRTELTAEQKEYLTNIRSSGNALVSIINDLLDISKIEAGKMELVEGAYNLKLMLSDIRMIIMNRIGSKPLELIYEIDGKLPDKLYGDEIRIRQVIINLMNNAVKFTEKGYVKLCIRLKEQTEDGFLIYVSVADTGQGIKKEDINRLFEAFEQVDIKKNQGKEGTGLGLAISSQLISMMGGKLEVDSQYGVGSVFFFTIIQKAVTAEIEEQESVQETTMNFTAPQARILIVDDNEMNRKVAVGLLKPFQMQLDVAENGKKALSMIKDKKYDMVFMDHMMPVMDGVEATKLLRQMDGEYYQTVPVVALTADAMQETQKKFTEAGMNDFVAKPIDLRQLCKTIQRWLPDDLIQKQSKDAEQKIQQSDSAIEDIGTIEGIDVQEGIKNSGNQEMFISLLGDFYKLIDMKAAKIESCMTDGLIKDYTIEVHALKNTARMIGALELSEQFKQLEQLGHAENINEIQEKTPKVLELYRSYKPILQPYGKMQEIQKREAPVEEIIMYLQGLQESVEGFDLDAADEAMRKVEECKLPENCIPLLEKLRVCVTDVAMEDIITITKEMIEIIKQYV